jgi:hypothetical protein
VFTQSLSSSALAAPAAGEKSSAAPLDQDDFNVTPEANDAAGALASALRKLADEIEKCPGATSTAAQAMGLSFMRDRLPPHPDQLPPSGKPPTLQSLVCCRMEVSNSSTA